MFNIYSSEYELVLSRLMLSILCTEQDLSPGEISGYNHKINYPIHIYKEVDSTLSEF